MIHLRTIRRAGWLLVLLVLSACQPSAGDPPPPNAPTVETSLAVERELPGMPDRPADAADIDSTFYREDSPEAIGATGKPQLIVFYRSNEEDFWGCFQCMVMLPTVIELEAEYWDRIDFVYLNMDQPDVEPVLEEFNIDSSIYRQRLSLFLMSAEGERVHRFIEVYEIRGVGAQPIDKAIFRTTFDRYLETQADGGILTARHI